MDIGLFSTVLLSYAVVITVLRNADPGCLSRIWIFSIQDPDPQRRALGNTVWSEMFIPYLDPGSEIFSPPVKGATKVVEFVSRSATSAKISWYCFLVPILLSVDWAWGSKCRLYWTFSVLNTYGYRLMLIIPIGLSGAGSVEPNQRGSMRIRTWILIQASPSLWSLILMC